ncbi:MAG: hypothetical protein ABJD66_06280 [Cellulophaga sp.]|uniref:hypothetical protein n=1 Tax=unclassified Cellulophaga TaxID=2634405 RepID=UPI000C2B8BFA|nr:MULTISPECIES: hypothetical protein [unclassified Cellulophaga]MDO6491138.1 hypothetical protein [Cellulophaga sp. 2_MG-2023]MDO6495329.1 hypothetical protein [Cellulophaga sp. 3_MG-2023]PKB42895.1 hypothetical protein AX016_1070 [Cellulophaga sp. RHA19]
MDSQDNNLKYKVIIAALAAVILGILIAFYYSNAQSNSNISYLEREKKMLTDKLANMQANIESLSSEVEVNKIDLDVANSDVSRLLDSIGQLNFDSNKYDQNKRELRRWQLKYDSLNIKYNSLKYNNVVLSESVQNAKKRADQYKAQALAASQNEEDLKDANNKLNKELKNKTYLKIRSTESLAFRVRNGRDINTNKANLISKLRACTTISGNPNDINIEKRLYLQFLDPNKKVISNNANIINVDGNEYSKAVDIIYTGINEEICEHIKLPSGSLKPGIYTLNVFEEQKLLSSIEFELK